MIHIQTMTSADYDDVYQLWCSCQGMGLNNIDDSQAGIAKFLARNPTTCFVAKDADKIVGVILAGHDGRRGFIYHLAVADSHRRQHIATNLTDHALKALAQEGIGKVALVVFNRNDGANAFWQAQGFDERQDLTYRNKALVAIQRYDT
ncbi:MAG: GNAT family N-acetyltransferase [Moraxella sp.]|nr:GNAT family N-acetyltransferase [Moraxella sp.]